MWKTIIDLLFPITCLGCNKQGQFICPVCFKKLPLNKNPLSKSDKVSGLTGLITTSYYNHPLIRHTVHRYKYDFVKGLAEPLGKLMTIQGRALIDKQSPILIPVPLHKKRLRWRGFNQAEELALIISKELNIPIMNDLIIRTKNTLPQVKIKTSSERQENIKNAFSLNSKQNFQNKTLILIDDISTTGATLEQCAQTLKQLNPKQIWGLIIAKG
ncbi:MAG: ComF family protein [bacterium]